MTKSADDELRRGIFLGAASIGHFILADDGIEHPPKFIQQSAHDLTSLHIQRLTQPPLGFFALFD